MIPSEAELASSRLRIFRGKKRHAPRMRVDRGMPLAGGRNIAASNIGNIDRQTWLFRRADNPRGKCRRRGLIKKYLQSAVITREARRREEEGGSRRRSCRDCQLSSSLVSSSSSDFFLLSGVSLRVIPA